VTAKPFIKFAGGKTALLPEILPRLPSKIRTYYEPFVGGGAVFWALEGRFERAVLGDINEEIVNLYSVVRMTPKALLKELKRLPIDEKSFYKIRAQALTGRLQRAARTIYLNKTAFNGLYRVNKKGEFNVPWGDYKNPTLAVDEVIHACSQALAETSLVDCDFEDTVVSAKRGDVVYFDPPYIPVSKTANFTGYAAGGFGDGDQERLRSLMEKLDTKGVHVLLSNSDTPRARELYDGFKIESVQAPRRVNSKGNKRGNVGELLISGRSP
jgi:DNA adenine methylase